MYSLVCSDIDLYLKLVLCALKLSHTTLRMRQVISQRQTQFAFRESQNIQSYTDQKTVNFFYTLISKNWTALRPRLHTQSETRNAM